MNIRELRWTVVCCLIITLGLVSCKEHIPDEETTHYDFYPRSARYLWADHASASIVTHEFPESFTEMKYSPIEADGSEHAGQYRLFVTTFNVDAETALEGAGGYWENHKYDDAKAFLNPLYAIPYVNERFIEDHDPEIEARLRSHYDESTQSLRNISSPTANYILIDYRTTPLKRIIVTFSKDLFGVAAGGSLNNLLDVDLRYTDEYNFIISGDKNVIWPRGDVISLKRYESYTPMAPVVMMLQFKNGVKLAEPVTGVFTFTAETIAGDILTDTTRPITLLP